MEKSPISEVLELIKKNYRFLLKISFFGALIGVLIALTTPEEYKVQVKLIPETTSSSGNVNSSISNLASLAGIDLSSNNTSTFNPGLYEQVVHSSEFVRNVLQTEFYFTGLKKNLNLFTFFDEHLNTSLIDNVIAVPKYAYKALSSLWRSEANQGVNYKMPDHYEYFSMEEKDAVKQVRERINVAIDWDVGLVSINVEFQDPYVCAQIAEFTQVYITEYVNDYYRTREEKNLKFVTEQYERAKGDFIQVQSELAKFRDEHRNLVSSSTKSQEEYLQAQHTLKFNIYNSLAQQKEQALIKVNEVAPVFKIVQPVLVPAERDSPDRKLIVFIFATIGGFIALSYLLLVDYRILDRL